MWPQLLRARVSPSFCLRRWPGLTPCRPGHLVWCLAPTEHLRGRGALSSACFPTHGWRYRFSVVLPSNTWRIGVMALRAASVFPFIWRGGKHLPVPRPVLVVGSDKVGSGSLAAVILPSCCPSSVLAWLVW